MGLTPLSAIKKECKYCMGDLRIRDCTSKICKLKDNSLSSLKKIKAHCLDCVETREDVRKCTGKLLFENHPCYLHEYRFGTNPKRKGIGRKGGNPNIGSIARTTTNQTIV